MLSPVMNDFPGRLAAMMQMDVDESRCNDFAGGGDPGRLA
jgi:hypothetical protein